MATLSTQPSSAKQPTIKRVSPVELQARREKGLCYNCDERFQPSHCCKCQCFLLIAEPDDSDNPPERPTETSIITIPETASNQPNEPSLHISLHALMGHTILQTLRVQGKIRNQTLTVLIDVGSTHNFFQDRVADQLGLSFEPSEAFPVMVGNGEELPCSYLCKNIELCLDGQCFTVDLFVIPLSTGAELVLGVQWMKTLGPVLTDYNDLTMSFTKNNQVIKISSSPKQSPTKASMHQLKCLASTQALDTVLQFHLIPPSPDLDHLTTHPPAKCPTPTKTH